MSEITWRSIPPLSISFKRIDPRSASFAISVGFKPPPWLEAWLCKTFLNPLARKCSSIAIVLILTPFPPVPYTLFILMQVTPMQTPLSVDRQLDGEPALAAAYRRPSHRARSADRG